MTSLLPHDLLPAGCDLPQPVRDTLRDLGYACNTAALDLAATQIRELDGIAAIDAAAHAPATRRLAGIRTNATMLYARQITAAYTEVAGHYAQCAAGILVGLFAVPASLNLADQLLPPSRLLADPIRHFPPIRIPGATMPNAARHTDGIRQTRADLISIIEATPPSSIGSYDRHDTSEACTSALVELSTGLPAALHAYAAAIVLAIGVARPSTAELPSV